MRRPDTTRRLNELSGLMILLAALDGAAIALGIVGIVLVVVL